MKHATEKNTKLKKTMFWSKLYPNLTVECKNYFFIKLREKKKDNLRKRQNSKLSV